MHQSIDNEMKKIIAFAGSNSSSSINRKLVAYTLEYFGEYATDFLDLNDFEMPIYSIDREKRDGVPDEARRFRKLMQEADGIVCSLAEHNRSYTVAFKNIFDWCSRVDMDIFANKPMLLMSTSPGGYGGGNVMNAAISFFPKCGVTNLETFSLPSFKQNFADGAITDEKLKKEHQETVNAFKRHLA